MQVVVGYLHSEAAFHEGKSPIASSIANDPVKSYTKMTLRRSMLLGCFHSNLLFNGCDSGLALVGPLF